MNLLTNGRVGQGLVTLLLAATSGLGGCVAHPKGTCGPACTAIKAALAIEFQSDRLDVLERIAARENLSTHEQVYLVNAVCYGGFSEDQADALVRLIENPCCTDQTREHIAKKLPWTRLGSAKKRVVEALIDHPSTGDSAAE